MFNYNSVTEGHGDTTVWDDIQTKLGNLPAKPPRWKPDPYQPEKEQVKNAEWIDKKDAEELSDLEDEFPDDRFLEEYRQKRIKEIQEQQRRPRFGHFEQIRGSEYVEKVTNASEDIWVILLLYKEGHPACGILANCLEELAPKHPYTKFLKIISTDCIPNYPDRNLPTVLVYHNKICQQHIIGMEVWGVVALTLNQYGPICATEDDQEESTRQHIKSLVQRVVKQQEEKDEDSDFD